MDRPVKVTEGERQIGSDQVPDLVLHGTSNTGTVIASQRPCIELGSWDEWFSGSSQVRSDEPLARTGLDEETARAANQAN